MPLDSQHINQAKHNIAFLESFYNSYKYNDWSITVAFYAAVHIMDTAIFKAENIKYKNTEIDIFHPNEISRAIIEAKIESPVNSTVGPFSTHTYRNIIVKENFPEAADWFMLLYRESINARYNKYIFSDNEVNLLVKPALENIIKWSNQNYHTDFTLSLK